MPSAITLNGFRVIRADLTFVWRGAWVGDLELDLTDVSDAPTGRCVLVAGGQSLVCFVDSEASATFQDRALMRVVGGLNNGWGVTVPPQQFDDPSGTLTTQDVYSQTALLCGEQVVDTAPQVVQDFARVSGPASNVFLDRQWYVDPNTGITQVGDWPGSVPEDESTVLQFDCIQLIASLSSEALVFPGCVLTDKRFNGVSYTVREVEHHFGASGNKVIAYCSANPANRLTEVFGQLVRSVAKTDYLRTYVYSFVEDSQGGLSLQAISDGAPDLNPIDQWVGLSGYSAEIASGANIVVGFVNADPRQPYLVSYSPLADSPSKQTFVSTGDFLVSAGGRVPKSHVATVEGVVNMFVNFVYFLKNAGVAGLDGPTGPLFTATFPANFIALLTPWLQACNLPTPPLPVSGGGLLFPTTKSDIDAALSGKQPNPIGLQPGIGSPGFQTE